MDRRMLTLMASAALFVGACGSTDPTTPSTDTTTTDATTAPEPTSTKGNGGKADPRDGGLEVGLGEWAVTLEADHVRPGEVTFVVTHHGTMGHGFEIEAEGDDSSGSGSGDGLKVEGRLLQPGQTQRITVDLAPGLYKVECLVNGHDDMGMQTMLQVSADAPLVGASSTGDGTTVAVDGFAFGPAHLEVPAGTEVTWENSDPTEHTVTASDGAFSSDPFGQGATYAHTFDQPGTFAYACAIHPEMAGDVTVTAA